MKATVSGSHSIGNSGLIERLLCSNRADVECSCDLDLSLEIGVSFIRDIHTFRAVIAKPS